MTALHSAPTIDADGTDAVRSHASEQARSHAVAVRGADTSKRGRDRPERPSSVADSEAALSQYFATRGAHGRRAVASLLRDPLSALRAHRLISRLSVVHARLDGSGEDALVRRGLLRTNRIARNAIRGTSAVLVLPDRPEDFLLGSSESKRSLRTKVNRAQRRGFQVVRPTSESERRRILAVADAYERDHPDERYRNTRPDNDYLLTVTNWLVAQDAAGKPLLLAVPAVSGEWSVLQHFKTLEASDDARLARFWMSAKLVEDMHAIGVRYIADTLSPIGLPPGLRDFQRRVGYRLVRVRVAR